jgi:hypothetical protein
MSLLGTPHRLQEYARKLEIPFLETSAKTEENVEAAFKTMAQHFLDTSDTKTNTAKLAALEN